MLCGIFQGFSNSFLVACLANYVKRNKVELWGEQRRKRGKDERNVDAELGSDND